MNPFASAYQYINQILQTQQEHNLSKQEIEALATAQKALLLVEMLGLATSKDSEII